MRGKNYGYRGTGVVQNIEKQLFFYFFRFLPKNIDKNKILKSASKEL